MDNDGTQIMNRVVKDCPSEFTKAFDVDMTLNFPEVIIEGRTTLYLCEEHENCWKAPDAFQASFGRPSTTGRRYLSFLRVPRVGK